MRNSLKRLRTWMFAVPTGPRPAWSAIAWWEARRLGFNVWVVATGCVGLALHAAAVRLGTGVYPSAAALGEQSLVVLVLMNSLYLIGWVFEIRFPPRDRVAIAAFLEMGCWLVGFSLIILPMIELVSATWSVAYTHGR